MGQSVEKRSRHAASCARSLDTLRRMYGPLVLEARTLTILHDVKKLPADADALCHALVTTTLPSAGTLAGLLGGRAIRVSTLQLAGWKRSIASLEGRGDLEDLIRDGFTPLRSYRDFPLARFLDDARARHQQLSELAASAATPGPTSPPPGWSRTSASPCTTKTTSS